MGGGDDNSYYIMQQQEAAKQAKRDAWVRAINEAFGVQEKPKPSKDAYMRQVPVQNAMGGGNPGNVGLYGWSGNNGGGAGIGGLSGGYGGIGSQNTQQRTQTVLDEKAYNAALAEWEAGLGKNDRKPIYDQVAADTEAYYAAKLQEEQRDAQLRLRDQLARQGLGGSSVAIDEGNRLRRAEDDSLMRISNQAQQAALQAKSADESARLEAIQLVNQDADGQSVLSNALSRMSTSASQALADARGSGLGNFFETLAFLNKARQEEMARGQALADYKSGSTPFTSGSSAVKPRITRT